MGIHTDVAGYILAGGKGKRMGGREKLYLCYEGKYLARRTMETLDMIRNFYISVAGIPEKPVGEAEWIQDLYPNEGPLGGIFSGLLLCPQTALFVVPCDMFGLTANLAERMLEAYRKTGKPVFLEDTGSRMPFPGIYTKEMIPAIERQRAEKNFRIRSLLQSEEAETYIFLEGSEELSGLENLNTENDYRRLQMRCKEEKNGNSKRSTTADGRSAFERTHDGRSYAARSRRENSGSRDQSEEEQPSVSPLSV